METIKNLWYWVIDILFKPATKIGLGVLVIGGFTAGAIFWGAFDKALDFTNEEEFCLACHTMHDNLLPELQKTVHWQNRTGVRARCPDCHVPHDFTDKIARKMQASREVFGHLIGTIGTREKFLDHRIVLAQREWERFKANNSKECRNCHDYDSMDFSKMRITSQMIMRSAAERDASCVDCHKGIAHQLPSLEGVSNPALDTLVSEASTVSVSAGNAYYNVLPQSLFSDAAMTQTVGNIEIATPVQVIAVEGEAAQIELTLWRKNKGFGRVWYADFGKNIVEAVIAKELAQDESLITVLDSKFDDMTGLEWQQVTAKLWVNTMGLMDSIEVAWNIAQQSYDDSCSVCHRQPSADSHTSNQWPGLFRGMVGFTNLDSDSANLVLKYLQLHSSDFRVGTHGGGSPESTIQMARP